MAGSNAAIMRRWYDDIWNNGRLETVDELLAPDAVLHAEPGIVVNGPAEFRAFYSKLTASFSDMRLEVIETLEDADRVAVRWHVKMKHAGEAWGGVEAARAEVVITGMTFAHLRAGRIVAAWDNWDEAGLNRQLRP